MKNDFVALGKVICPICEKISESGEIIIHKHMKPISEEMAVTGFGLCAEHKKEGFMVLIEIDEKLSDFNSSNEITPQGAYKTGRFIHIKKEAAKKMFSIDVSKNAFVYIDKAVFDKLEKLHSQLAK